jgi:hypothetical protein
MTGKFMNNLRNRLLPGLAGLLLLATPHAARAADHLVSPVDFWFYLDNGVDQGTAWRAPEFSHFDWNFGISELGFGDGDEFTELTPSPGGVPLNTAYFRTRFSVDDPAAYANVTIRLLRDDGGVVYINGVEVFRSNMPTGQVSYATSAIRNISGTEESSMAQRVVPGNVLGPINTIAVEIHQAAGGQDDMSFALELIGHRVGENQPPSAHTTFATTEQDKPGNLVLNATDPDNNPLSYTVIVSPAHGTLSGEAPNLVYTPHAGYVGSDLLSFKATDGQWATEVAYVSIEVIPASNHPPVANAQNVSVDEDKAVALTLHATDPDGDTLTYTHSLPAHGTLSGSGNSLVYQPAPNYNGSDIFTFSVNDGNGETATAVINIVVLPVNDLPVAGSPTVKVPEDGTLAIVLSATDIEGDVLSFSFTQPAHGKLTGSGATISYQPEANYYGVDSFTYSVSDGAGLVTATVSITVSPVNDTPVAMAKAAPAHAPKNFSRKLVVLALNNRDTQVILDGSASVDVDSVLAYAWFLNGSAKALSTVMSPVVTLPVGNHSLALLVSDKIASSSDTITVQVITAGDLVRPIIQTLDAAALTPGERNSPLHYLKAACADFDAGNLSAGVQELKLFQARVTEKVQNLELAKQLIEDAQTVIDLVKSQSKVPAALKPRRKR